MQNVRRELDSNSCTSIVKDSERLKALSKTGQMGSARDEGFDRLTRLAAMILDVPLTIVSFVSEDQQFFKSFYGLPEPWATGRVIPIDNSVCQYTLVGHPLALEDVKEHPLLAGNPAIPALNLVAYLGIPMLTQDGHSLGAFCAIDSKRRVWSEREIEIMRELTNSVMSEIELRITLEKLRSESEVRQQFIATMTHDLRSPLATAQMSAQIISEEHKDSVICARESERVLKLLRRADELILSVLDEHRIAGGKDALAFELVNFSDLLSEILDGYTPDQRSRLAFDLKAFDRSGRASREGIRRAIENLISNALKYSPPESKVTIELHASDPELVISVHNEGNPISEADQKLIFEPFHRSASAQASKVKGWGLGLPLVRAVAKEHGGSIEIVSNLDIGTTFRLILNQEP